MMEREDVLGTCSQRAATSRRVLEELGEKPIVGDVRGAGYFMSLELVRDKETKETFTDDECERLLRGFLSPRLYDAGLICRADDRGDPVIQLSPPLIATREDLDFIHDVLDTVLDEAWTEMNRSGRREAVATRNQPRVLTVSDIVGIEELEIDPPRRRGRRGPARCAGCTSRSSTTPPRGCGAASSC